MWVLARILTAVAAVVALVVLSDDPTDRWAYGVGGALGIGIAVVFMFALKRRGYR